MDFSLSEEQTMTCDVARKFFAREFPLRRLREMEVQGLEGFMPVYRGMGELGFLGIGVREDCGGGGGNWLDLALFAEEAGANGEGIFRTAMRIQPTVSCHMRDLAARGADSNVPGRIRFHQACLFD